ncbi:MAG: aldo/keto reductase [Nannocystaceae bacterium]
MTLTPLANTDLHVHPLCLGGNVFGWTAAGEEGAAVLDRYAAAGGNFIDTADVYSAWVPGNAGGESEAFIGRWLAQRGRRDDLIIATKVGLLESRPGLSRANIIAACDDSLRRLGVDTIDLYYAHRDDEATPIEETLAAFQALIDAGKIRYAAASNYSAPRLRRALELGAQAGLARFVAVEPEYSLLHRADLEDELAPVCRDFDLPAFPYWALASGLLTGKYRGGDADTKRGESVERYAAQPEADAVIAALAEVAEAREVSMAAAALAWCRANPLVPSVIASARTTAQLDQLLPFVELELTREEKAKLDAAASTKAAK